ncbi:angiopoietin-related protein 3-like [Odontesthes bonariensis]|uniref:angiopoietin-related protein 3-like n=1 Tax=Odontesthes bonariensis TaxID=219752 RepID=UPI003F584F72
MRIPIIFMFFLAAACVPALCDKEEPQVHIVSPPETRSRFALLDDVRLLANGLLQLGQSMRDFMQKTKGQINDIFQKLNIFDRSFYQLTALASEIKEEEEELKKTTVVLQARNEEIKGLSEEIHSKMESIRKDKSQLQNKVKGLEEKLSSLSMGLVTSTQVAEINSLREVIHTQEQSITELLKAMKEQSEQLNHQRMKIRILEGKFTTNKLMFFNPEVPTLTPYLTKGSTSSSSTMDLPSDCSELFDRGERVSGVYAIKPNRSEPFMAFCDMSRDYGATVIQQRRDGSVNFDQPWERYENGFGDFQGEFWLGLKKIHSLASQGNFILHILVEDWVKHRLFIEYRLRLDGPESNYTVHLVRLSGNLPDPMSDHRGVMFSTVDRFNQQDSSCGPPSGGWWLNMCGDAHPNGRYLRVRPSVRSERGRGIQWRSGPKGFFSVKFAQISVRPLASSSTNLPTPASSQSGVFL